MIIKARDLKTEHIGHAVHIARWTNNATFVLAGFDSLIWEPNPYVGPGHVTLHDRQGRHHQVGADDQIEVEP